MSGLNKSLTRRRRLLRGKHVTACAYLGRLFARSSADSRGSGYAPPARHNAAAAAGGDDDDGDDDDGAGE